MPKFEDLNREEISLVQHYVVRESRATANGENREGFVMNLPDKEQAQALLEHVQDAYQRHHALMVATAMEGYAGSLEQMKPFGG